MRNSKFKQGDLVSKVYHGPGGYTERVRQRIHHIAKGVVYLQDGQGGYETGITYDAITGVEKELFFPGIWSEIKSLRKRRAK